MRSRSLVMMFAALAALTLGGCSWMQSQPGQTATHYLVNGAVLGAEINAVIPEIAQGEKAIAEHWSSYSQSEQTQLLQSRASIDKAVALVNAITAAAGGAAGTIVSLSQVQAVYAQAKAGYENARPVIEAHMSEFSPAQQAEWSQLDKQAHTLDHAMTALQTAPTPKAAQVQQVLMTALQVAGAAAKIAVAAGA